MIRIFQWEILAIYKFATWKTRILQKLNLDFSIEVTQFSIHCKYNFCEHSEQLC